MIRGLDIFREHFKEHIDKFVLIGGVACYLVMDNVGLSFRATKDLDIVLYIEALNSQFVSHFWKFIIKGKYQVRERSTGGKEFFRFVCIVENSHQFKMGCCPGL